MKKLLFVVIAVVGMAFSVCAQARYEKSIELGAAVGTDKFSKYSFQITMVNGLKFNDYFSAGVGLGFRYADVLYQALTYADGTYSDSRNNEYLIPLYARVKVNLTKTQVSPFFLADVGYSFNMNNSPYKNLFGLMVEPAFGIDYKFAGEKMGLYFLVGFNLQKAQYRYTSLSRWRNPESELIKGMANSITFRGGINF